jgi:SAM-dependent methyltransferase
MKQDARNLTDYVKRYKDLAFEPIQIEYRRKLVLNQVLKRTPRKILEVGCGLNPLFVDLSQELEIIVIEPAEEFAEHARKLAAGRKNVQVLQGFIESVDLEITDLDMVILGCVLHEVPDPSAILKAIRRHCKSSTTLHVNVPNSKSLHRLLAVAMGLIPTESQQSDMQKLMQQRQKTYNIQSLKDELLASGFEVVEEGSLFVKPFTHVQMQVLVDSGFMTRAMLDGLDNLVNLLPELGSEIWVNAKKIE